MSDSRFAMVQAQYRSLRTAFDAGRIDAAAFEAALDATAFEHAGRLVVHDGHTTKSRTCRERPTNNLNCHREIEWYPRISGPVNLRC